MHKSPPRARKPHRGQDVVKRKRKNVWIRYSLDCRVWFRTKGFWANVTLPSKLTMTDSSTHPRLPISTTAVKAQFARRGNLSDAQFLYAEVADRMLDRLKLIRMQPERILDAGCGAGSGITLLKNRYPSARVTGQDFNTTALAAAQKTHHTGVSGLLKKLTGKSNPILWLSTDLADTGLAPESLDLIWSNLAIHWHPAPHDVLREWARIVKLNGLVFFSCFGPDTLKEVRQALVSAKLVTQTPAFVDMHDFGDLLVENGFGDPVMDSGPGFPAHVLQRVFEPYVTTKAQGTGLGLAIVRKIVEEHGGRIDVSNRRDGGARVSILFTRLATRVELDK